MVVGKPYIHFKVNNEPLEEIVDYNYTWATVVEAQKGPINVPTYISSASQANAIFGVDMRPYFAQSPRSLIMIRAAAESETNAPQKGKYTFNLAEDVALYRAVQNSITLTNTESYEENGQTKTKDVQYKFNLFYAVGERNQIIPLIEHRNSNGNLIPDEYIDSWHNNGRIITAEDVEEDNSLTQSNIYHKNQVKEFLSPMINNTTCSAGTPLFEVESKYEGVYNISISCVKSLTEGYRIVFKDEDTGKILLIIPNGTNIRNIVNRINDADLDIVATMTDAGEYLTEAMISYPNAITTTTVSGYGSLITSNIIKNSFIMKQGTPSANGQLTIAPLTKNNYLEIQNSKNGKTSDGTFIVDYAINLEIVGDQSLVGGNKGEWDENQQRIAQQYQAEAHRKALETLRKIRLAGVFCMYGETAIQYEYLQHGINDNEPEKGMNNNETCKWRTILLGANETDRDDISSLMAKAKNINNQYVLFLGQGLVDTGMTGHISTLSIQEKKALGSVNDNHLLPYECTQYIAGLRSKLNYGEAIFGGQGRKRIRSVGDLEIAPLLSYQTEYVWEPNDYVRLNEHGVLTFTEEYGNITLTDGVTTMQDRTEEDEEGTMNILKYAQNAIYDVCLPYIGRNIDADLENSLTTAIEKVLEQMKATDMTLIDTEEYPAYDVSVALNSRRNQLLGKIYVYVLICPVHAVRQIEVEMTVQ